MKKKPMKAPPKAMMKKAAIKKAMGNKMAGARKMKSGGKCRGAGAATKGTRYSKS
jgi:hypothetical protein